MIIHLFRHQNLQRIKRRKK